MPNSKPRRRKCREEKVKSSDVLMCPHCNGPLDIIHVSYINPHQEGLQVVCRKCSQFVPKWITTKRVCSDDD